MVSLLGVPAATPATQLSFNLCLKVVKNPTGEADTGDVIGLWLAPPTTTVLGT